MKFISHNYELKFAGNSNGYNSSYCIINEPVVQTENEVFISA
jgi:hypothetical protein